MHEFVNCRRDDQVGDTKGKTHPEQHHVGISVLADLRASLRAVPTTGCYCGNQAGYILGHRDRQEPAAHGHAGFLFRCQLGHHRQANRRQAELTGCVQQVCQRQEEPGDQARSVLEVGDSKYQDVETCRNLNQTQGEFSRYGRVHIALVQPWPHHGK